MCHVQERQYSPQTCRRERVFVSGNLRTVEKQVRVARFAHLLHRGANFRVAFSYGPGAVFRRPIRRLWRKAYFLLYGRIDLSYNPHRDVLTLSDYGEYVRSDD